MNPCADDQPVSLTAMTGASNVVHVNIHQAASTVLCDTLNHPSMASVCPKATSTAGVSQAASTFDCNIHFR